MGVITRVAVEHLEFFASVDEIALAERELIENLAWPNATAVLNADDERVARFAEVARGRAILFGDLPRAEFRAENDRGAGRRRLDVRFCVAAGRVRLELPLIGRHNVMNALAALAAASVWGSERRKRGECFRRSSPQISVARWCGLTMDLPSSTIPTTRVPRRSIRWWIFCASTPGYRRRILAAGRCWSWEPRRPELHRVCGQRAGEAEEEIDWIFGVKGDAAELVRAAVDAGHAEERAQFFENSEEAAKFIERFIEPGDLLLAERFARRADGENYGSDRGEARESRFSGRSRCGDARSCRRAQLRCCITSFSLR